ncbi:hypothetical protein FQ187_14745 [Pseudomonas sp. ANT_J28]|nr:hypothetical protein FQ187_14745 [Pseudomonas sp. ANT_J28]
MSLGIAGMRRGLECMHLDGSNKACAVKETGPSNRRANVLQRCLTFKRRGICRSQRTARRPVCIGAAGVSV